MNFASTREHVANFSNYVRREPNISPTAYQNVPASGFYRPLEKHHFMNIKCASFKLKYLIVHFELKVSN